MAENKEPPKVVRMMNIVQPVVRRDILTKLQEAGYVDSNGYIDIISLMEGHAQLERSYQLKLTLLISALGAAGALILKFW